MPTSSLVRKLTLICLLFLTAGPSALVAAPVPQSQTGLSAHVFLVKLEVTNLNQVEVVAVLTNSGPTNVSLNMFTLATPPLSLEVLNPKGKVVPPEPPSAPKANEDQKYLQLRAGQSTTLKYTLRGYRTETPPGRYHLRMKSIPSNEVGFTIR